VEAEPIAGPEPAHAHGHRGHAHAERGRDQRRRLAAALALALTYMVAEVAGGLWTGSLALLADAGHMLSDAAALALALFASWIASRPSGERFSFGLARAEILAALAQGAALVAVALLVGIEAVARLARPAPVLGSGMFAIAAGGLVVNAIGLAILAGGRRESLNIRGAWLHVLSDAFGSVGAMAAAALVWAFGWYWADPAASLAIVCLVLLSAWHLLRDAVDVLMEAAPRHLDLHGVEAELTGLDGVLRVHDLHVWTIGSGEVCLSCHLVVARAREETSLLSDAYRLLGSRFGIDHATLQIEPEGFAGQTPRSVCAGACSPARTTS
jgi:cobalt-zinc-cadmium efflux system protein